MDTNAHRHAPRAVERVTVPVEASLRGRFVRRYKRFFADVELETGGTVTVHCANPGSMLGFDRPGAAVRCSTSDNPKRKLRHTLEMMRIGRTWVGLQTLRANHVVAAVLAAGALEPLAGYRTLKREVRVDGGVRDGGSRLDFALSDHPGDPRTAYLEVKSVTLARAGVARFPDSVTERGRRHLETLAELHRRGHRAALLFLVQRADCHRVEPAAEIDPAYAEALRAAAKQGVEIFAIGARVTSRAITVERMLPVTL
jgi:sugar fermentation stimulation protein A